MITVISRKPEKFDGDILVYCLLQRKKNIPESGGNIKKIVRTVCKSGAFTGQQGQVCLLYPKLFDQALAGSFDCGCILLVGLGKKNKNENEMLEQVRLAGGVIANQGRTLKAENICVVLPEMAGLSSSATAEAMSEGLVLGNYSFDKYKALRDDNETSAPVRSFLLSDKGETSPIRKGLKKRKNCC